MSSLWPSGVEWWLDPSGLRTKHDAHMSFPTSAVPQPGNRASADTMDNIPIQLGTQDLNSQFPSFIFLSYLTQKKKNHLELKPTMEPGLTCANTESTSPGDPLTEAVFLLTFFNKPFSCELTLWERCYAMKDTWKGTKLGQTRFLFLMTPTLWQGIYVK